MHSFEVLQLQEIMRDIREPSEFFTVLWLFSLTQRALSKPYLSEKWKYYNIDSKVNKVSTCKRYDQILSSRVEIPHHKMVFM